MTPWWLDLLKEQERAGFADLRGARASIRIPVSDRLLTRVITDRLPSTSTVREIELQALDGNECTVRVRLRPAFLPTVSARLLIEEQPRLPHSPVLTLRIVSKGLAALASGPLASAFRLPAGFTLHDDRLRIDLAALARQYGAEAALGFLKSLELTTERGHLVVSADAALPTERSS
jgi:hypothetical protein